MREAILDPSHVPPVTPHVAPVCHHEDQSSGNRAYSCFCSRNSRWLQKRTFNLFVLFFMVSYRTNKLPLLAFSRCGGIFPRPSFLSLISFPSSSSSLLLKQTDPMSWEFYRIWGNILIPSDRRNSQKQSFDILSLTFRHRAIQLFHKLVLF